MALTSQTPTTASTARGYLRRLENNLKVKRHFERVKANAGNNRYYFHSKITERQFKKIVHLFSRDLTATQISEKTELSRITINKVLMEIRERIAQQAEEKQIPKQGFAPTNKHDLKQVLGIKVKDKKVQVEFVSNCCKDMFAEIYGKGKNARAIIFKHKLNQYTALVDINKKRYLPTNNRLQGFRTCEKFWNAMYEKILKSRGIRQEAFYLHMKECELRHNLQNKEKLNDFLMQMIKTKPLASFYRNPN